MGKENEKLHTLGPWGNSHKAGEVLLVFTPLNGRGFHDNRGSNLWGTMMPWACFLTPYCWITDPSLTSESQSLVLGKRSIFLQGYVHRIKSIEPRSPSAAPKFKDSQLFMSPCTQELQQISVSVFLFLTKNPWCNRINVHREPEVLGSRHFPWF